MDGTSRPEPLQNAQFTLPLLGGQTGICASFVVPPLIPPASDGYGDKDIDRVVELAYESLLKKRGKFLDETRIRLNSNPGLPDRVKKFLHEWDCGAVWECIAPITANGLAADSAVRTKARWVTFTHAPEDPDQLP